MHQPVHKNSFLQGGIDGGGLENPMSAAVRELKEETGISSARIVAIVSFLSTLIS